VARRVVKTDPLLGPLTCDRITADYRVWQRARGHRFSVDDVATALTAFAAAPGASRILDLGCGLGSVLLVLAWKCPHATLVGIEAQAMSYELARRNVALNSLEARVTVHHGDLRYDSVLDAAGTGFDLVTGTPPYFAPDAALQAEDEQRAFARIEYRGGVEAYVAAAARAVAPGGRIVLCGSASAPERVENAARAHGLAVLAQCDLRPREGHACLFSIWTLAEEPATADGARSEIVLRDAAGERTEDARRLTELCGLSVVS